MSLLDPTYASKYIPIIASVSEHQPPSWPSYITDLHFAVLLAPAGLIACFKKLDDGKETLKLKLDTDIGRCIHQAALSYSAHPSHHNILPTKAIAALAPTILTE